MVVVNFLNKANAADVRVYDLLEKNLNFLTAFLVQVISFGKYRKTELILKKELQRFIKTVEQMMKSIKLSDQLKSEYKDDIADEFKKTRHNLLENFDEEVHEKLRINLKESKEYLSKYEALL